MVRHFVSGHRRLAAAVALLGTLVPVNAALASAGCDAVNAGAFNFSVAAGAAAERDAQTFAAGEVLSFTITRVNPPMSDGADFRLADNDTLILLVSRAGTSTSESGSYTVTAAALNIYTVLESFGSSASVTMTCTPVVTGPTDSQKLRAVQVQGTKIVAQTSGGAISGAVASAIGQSIGSGAGSGAPPSTGGPAGLGGPKPYGLGRTARGEDQGAGSGTAAFALERQRWSAWGDLRFTDSRRSPDAGGFEGEQWNGTAGIGRVVAPGVVVGAFGGFERFDYDIASLAGGLSGHGATGGAYLGWRLMPGILFDLAGASSVLAYEATAGAATGSFDGRRKLVSTGLVGSTRLGGFVVDPSARLFAIWEKQDAYTDSLGAAQAAHSFSVGRASAGVRVSRPVPLAGGAILAPYAGLYGDYHFSSGEIVVSGTEVLAIEDGWSARVTGGVALSGGDGASLTLGGEWGGLGADHRQRSLVVRGVVPF